ncbi:MAG: YqgE/AlgH family protein, partial [Pseudomonadota bacterium]
MEQISALTDNFLIAMPNMNDPNFSHSVTYICEHNENGALGLVINRPSSVKLAEVFSQMEIKYKNVDASDMHILFGGPINQERGFVIHQPQKPWRSSFMTSDDIMITTSKDILEALAQSQGP